MCPTNAEENIQPSSRESHDFLAAQSKELLTQKKAPPPPVKFQRKSKAPPPPVKFQRKSNTNSAIRSAGISAVTGIPARDIQPFLHTQGWHVHNLILESDIPAVEMHSKEQEAAELIFLEYALNFSMA
jgi:hypothetical protein